jgi:glyoxylase-like metal-dependent hydrolase (beta-lactamase superfamily II)
MDIKRIIVGPLQTNCYLLVDGGELAVIDPGGDAGRILDEIAKTGAKTKLIINTHCHPDHTEANNQIRAATGAPILIHENEKPFITEFAASRFLKDGDKIKIAKITLKTILTPGHTKGSICLFADRSVFSGDTIFSYVFGRTDLKGGSDKDMATSLKKLDELILEGTMVYPGHGDIFKYKKGMTLKWLDYLN